MYRPITLLVATLTLASSLRVLAETVTTLAYDTIYDNATLSLNRVACSNGTNGLETKNPNYTTLGSLPIYPDVGGAYTVSGWDSTECGTCYAVTFENVTINILALDVSKTGFTVSQAAMNTLTGNQAAALGRVNVSFVSVPSSTCGVSTSS